MSLSFSLPLALAAAVIEALIGYPAPLYRAFRHPVTWMGGWLAWLEARLNRADAGLAARRAAGVLALGLYLAPVALVAWAATRLCLSAGALGFAALAFSPRACRRSAVSPPMWGPSPPDSTLASTKAAARSRRPSGAIRTCWTSWGWRAPRSRVLAENFSDGVVAPILWIAFGGLIGGALYKAINTADSMIGHKDERYKAFGWAAARLDDLVNLPASRLAALWLILAAVLTPGASAREAARAVWRDAPHHRSPNAGWPEAAMAGALGIKLAGPRVYGETLVDDAFMGAGRREADAADVRRALRLYRRACVIEAVTLLVVSVILSVGSTTIMRG